MTLRAAARKTSAPNTAYRASRHRCIWPFHRHYRIRAEHDLVDSVMLRSVDVIEAGWIRSYRERQLEGTGLEPLFPLWEVPTHRSLQET